MEKETLSTNGMADASDEFGVLYETHAPLIYRFMFWRTKDKMLAEDLTSNVFEKAWRTRRSFTGGSAKAWLHRIARTTLIDHWRKKRELPDDGAIDQAISEAISLEEATDLSLERARLRQALSKLPKSMRAVVYGRFIQGRSVRETARGLGLSEANVRVVQYRALQKLKDLLQ